MLGTRKSQNAHRKQLLKSNTNTLRNLIALILCLCLVSRTYSQTTLINNGDTLTCLSEKELDIVIGAFIERDGCLEAYDTLAIGFDACNSANVQLEAINTILTNDLEISKVVIQSTEQQNKDLEKTLKRKQRANKFNKALLWGLSGISAALMVLYLVKQ